MYRIQQAFTPANSCGQETSIQLDIRACLATLEERLGGSSAIMAYFFSPTPTQCFSGRSRSTSIPSALLRGSCGETGQHRRIPCTLICGMTILNQPELIPQPENLSKLP